MPKTFEHKWLRGLAIGWLLALVIVAIVPSLLTSPDPFALDLGNSLSPPNRHHWAGTDALGRDLLTRVAMGARASIAVTAGATSLSLGLGVVLGGLGGWHGGWLGSALQLMISLFWSVPFVALVILLVAVLGVSPWTLIVAIGGINWVVSARIFRAEAERLRTSEFVRGTRALGFGSWLILSRHIAPHLWPLLCRLAVFGAIEILTLETGLAFLGLSLPPPQPTWGGLVAEGLEHLHSAWWVGMVPSFVILFTLVSLRALVPERISPAVV